MSPVVSVRLVNTGGVWQAWYRHLDGYLQGLKLEARSQAAAHREAGCIFKCGDIAAVDGRILRDWVRAAAHGVNSQQRELLLSHMELSGEELREARLMLADAASLRECCPGPVAGLLPFCAGRRREGPPARGDLRDDDRRPGYRRMEERDEQTAHHAGATAPAAGRVQAPGR